MKALVNSSLDIFNFKNRKLLFSSLSFLFLLFFLIQFSSAVPLYCNPNIPGGSRCAVTTGVSSTNISYNYYIGNNGTDGINGTNGTDGINGTNGADGVDGINGTNGIDGINGTNGVDGVNGSNGTAGIDGVNGSNGTAGIDGVNGSVDYANIVMLNQTNDGNITLGIGSWFKGLFNWTVIGDWFSFDGATLSFNETKLNNTINNYVTTNGLGGNSSWNQSLADSSYLKLDQSTPQSVTGDAPIFTSGLKTTEVRYDNGAVNLLFLSHGGGGYSVDEIIGETGLRYLNLVSGSTLNLNPNGLVRVKNAYYLPATDGSSNYVLTAHNNGTTSWEAVSGGSMNYTNLALTNQTNTFTQDQQFNGNITNSVNTTRGMYICPSGTIIIGNISLQSTVC